jgi:hypothetical protein
MAEKMQPWMKAAIAVAGDDVLRDIVNDNRNPPRPAAPPSNVVPQGAGKVQTFDVGPAYRPIDPSLRQPPKEEAPAERSGWRDQQALKPPDGVALVDQLCDQQDLADFEARCREQAARMGISYPDWLRLMEKDLRERRERREKAAKDRKETPK